MHIKVHVQDNNGDKKKMISERLKQKIMPHLLATLPKAHAKYIDSCFEEVYQVEEDGQSYIVLQPPKEVNRDEQLSLMFSELTGACIGPVAWQIVKKEGVLL